MLLVVEGTEVKERGRDSWERVLQEFEKAMPATASEEQPRFLGD